MCGLEQVEVLNAINVVMVQKEDFQQAQKMVFDYDVDNVSSKVLRSILSYTNYVNREVWKKY
jgi:UDP-N-acetylglucosamine 2-epimerase (non-hydrolysing)